MSGVLHEVTKLFDSDGTDDVFILIAAAPIATATLLATHQRKLWTIGLILAVAVCGVWTYEIATNLSDRQLGECSQGNYDLEIRTLIANVIAMAVVVPLIVWPGLLASRSRLRWLGVAASLVPAATLAYLIATVTGCD
jgi:hypothetical protein